MSAIPWLHGWPRLGGDHGLSVLIGSAIRCIGCGKGQGVTCTVFDPDWEYPDRQPDYPFPEDACPVCWLSENWEPPDAPSWPKGKPRPLP